MVYVLVIIVDLWIGQLLGKEEWLYGIAEQPDKHLDMVKYYDYDPTKLSRLK